MPVTQPYCRDAGWSHRRRHSLRPASERNHHGSAPSDSGVQTAHCWKGRLDSATNVSHALLRLISVTVFNFTHPPALSALLQVISASRFLTPDFLLLVPVPFLFSVHLSPSYLTETLSGLLYIKPEVISFPKTLDLTVFHFVLMSSSVSS